MKSIELINDCINTMAEIICICFLSMAKRVKSLTLGSCFLVWTPLVWKINSPVLFQILQDVFPVRDEISDLSDNEFIPSKVPEPLKPSVLSFKPKDSTDLFGLGFEEKSVQLRDSSDEAAGKLALKHYKNNLHPEWFCRVFLLILYIVFSPTDKDSKHSSKDKKKKKKKSKEVRVYLACL